MKRLILGDIHGHWQTAYDIYNKENPELVIILGDYVDGFSHGTAEEAKECLDKIRELKKSHEQKYGENTFITIIGNHDYHYIQWGEHYSGYRHQTQMLCGNLLKKMLENGELVFIYVDRKNKSIYSHAGISNTWIKEEVGENVPVDELNETVSPECYRFTLKGGFDMYGDTIYSSPIWIRPFSLGKDQLIVEGEEWRQVVGHTQCKKIIDFNIEKFVDFKEHTNLILCDSLPRQYMVENLNDNKVIIDVEYKDYEQI